VSFSEKKHESISRHDFIEVVLNKHTNQKSIHALVSFKKEELICLFAAKETFETPNYLTLQIDLNKHISLYPEFLQYTNHGCSPNVFFDTTNMKLVAIKEIEIGDELLFFYPSTELDMAQSFLCSCESVNCIKNIQGALHLDEEVLKNYRLNDFIQSQLNNIKQSGIS